MPRAAGLAAEIQKDLSLDVELIKSKGGVFEVKLDDEQIYSKKALGRFPDPGEVENLLRGKIA